LQKRGKPTSDALKALEYLSEIVELVDSELYSEFEVEATERLRCRDESDWPILAIALALSCPIWTEDSDFFGVGIAVWRTARVEIFLKSQMKHENTE
jgi:predicted nucleic acid-binding protein